MACSMTCMRERGQGEFVILGTNDFRKQYGARRYSPLAPPIETAELKLAFKYHGIGKDFLP